MVRRQRAQHHQRIGSKAMRENLVDAIGMIILTGLVIAFGTNLVTENWNIWALMARFGGAV